MVPVPKGDQFADVLTANAEYAREFSRADLDGRAARGLAVLTCIDSRIDPLAMLGLKSGDAKIVRNAGGREDELHSAIREAGGPETSDLTFSTSADQAASICSDVERVRSFRRLDGLQVGGFVYDVTEGLLTRIC